MRRERSTLLRPRTATLRAEAHALVFGRRRDMVTRPYAAAWSFGHSRGPNAGRTTPESGRCGGNVLRCCGRGRPHSGGYCLPTLRVGFYAEPSRGTWYMIPTIGLGQLEVSGGLLTFHLCHHW